MRATRRQNKHSAILLQRQSDRNWEASIDPEPKLDHHLNSRISGSTDTPLSQETKTVALPQSTETEVDTDNTTGATQSDTKVDLGSHPGFNTDADESPVVDEWEPANAAPVTIGTTPTAVNGSPFRSDVPGSTIMSEGIDEDNALNRYWGGDEEHDIPGFTVDILGPDSELPERILRELIRLIEDAELLQNRGYASSDTAFEEPDMVEFGLVTRDALANLVGYDDQNYISDPLVRLEKYGVVLQVERFGDANKRWVLLNVPILTWVADNLADWKINGITKPMGRAQRFITYIGTVLTHEGNPDPLEGWLYAIVAKHATLTIPDVVIHQFGKPDLNNEGTKLDLEDVDPRDAFPFNKALKEAAAWRYRSGTKRINEYIIYATLQEFEGFYDGRSQLKRELSRHLLPMHATTADHPDNIHQQIKEQVKAKKADLDNYDDVAASSILGTNYFDKDAHILDRAISINDESLTLATYHREPTPGDENDD